MVFVRTLFLKDTRLVYLDCNSLEDCRNALTARSGVPPDQLIFYKVSFTSSFQAFCFKNSGFSKADRIFTIRFLYRCTIYCRASAVRLSKCAENKSLSFFLTGKYKFFSVVKSLGLLDYKRSKIK